VIFQLIRSGELASVRIGRSRRIPVTALQDYVARLQEPGVTA
jgi:excisionase family DNA binding protein